MKVGFFDYLIDEDVGGLLDQYKEEIIKPLKEEKGFDLEHKAASLLEANYDKYDIIIFHPRITFDIRKLPPIEELIVDKITKPLLVVSGTDTKIDYVKANIRGRGNLEYNLLKYEKVLEFINRFMIA